jgi:hypothetical protein
VRTRGAASLFDASEVIELGIAWRWRMEPMTEAIPGTVMDEAAWRTSFAAAGLRRPLIRTLGGCMAGGTL